MLCTTVGPPPGPSTGGPTCVINHSALCVQSVILTPVLQGSAGQWAQRAPPHPPAGWGGRSGGGGRALPHIITPAGGSSMLCSCTAENNKACEKKASVVLRDTNTQREERSEGERKDRKGNSKQAKTALATQPTAINKVKRYRLWLSIPSYIFKSFSSKNTHGS